MASNYPVNMVSVYNALYPRRGLLLAVFLGSFLAGVAAYFIIPRKYEAKAEFFLRNPLYTDRSTLFNNEGRTIEYFASEDDMNRVVSMAQADSLQYKIIRDLRLAEAYDYDVSVPRDMERLRKKFSKRLNIWRSENKSLELSYEDRDPVRAAAVANLAVALLEHSVKGFYRDTRSNMYQTIMNKVTDEDSMISRLTDSLVRLREQYGIYDIISPSRNNIMISHLNSDGRPGFARGIEQIQNVASVKDQLVTDRARQLSIANQYTSEAGTDVLPLIHIIRSAIPPYKPLGPGWALMGFTCALLGLLFSALFVLLSFWYRKTI